MARILVIDDDDDIAALVGLKLRLDGHEVTLESDGASGLDRVLTEPPDLLIVDWTLPGLTGPEICERVRGNPATSGLYKIMLTARPLGENGVAESGADEVMRKPFSPRELSTRVSAALARSAGERA